MPILPGPSDKNFLAWNRELIRHQKHTDDFDLVYTSHIWVTQATKVAVADSSQFNKIDSLPYKVQGFRRLWVIICCRTFHVFAGVFSSQKGWWRTHRTALILRPLRSGLDIPKFAMLLWPKQARKGCARIATILGRWDRSVPSTLTLIYPYVNRATPL